MEKRFLIIGLVFLFLFSSVVPISIGSNVKMPNNITQSSNRGNTLYVGGNGPYNFTKIMDAVDNASDGDTVFVFNGTYYENIIVNKSISLIGENKNTTVIDGFKKGTVVNITGFSITIKGFTIQNSGINREDAGIGIGSDSSYNNIQSNIISKNYFGIYLFPNDLGMPFDNSIMENIITGNMGGIRLIETYYNDVYGNFINGNHCGIEIQAKNIPNNILFQQNQPFGNNILRNILSNNSIAITISHCSNNKIYENEIVKNNQAVYIEGSYHVGKNNEIYKNNISDNEEGIYLRCLIDSGGNENKIYQNNFLNNKKTAYFENSYPNSWDDNYWNQSRFFPYIIFGCVSPFQIFPGIVIPYVNFDWHPALKPYDIGI